MDFWNTKDSGSDNIRGYAFMAGFGTSHSSGL